MPAGTIYPPVDLYRELNEVESPARYVGGEYGSIVKDDDSLFRVAVSFPDLYEIGMSNTAIKLIYGMLNTLDDVACERVFVPAPDFEAALRRRGIPLYTLESGIPVGDTDLLAISYGYELLATNVLTLLAASGLPRRREERGDGDPLVLVGGPGATNPLPLAPFVDGVFVGEAEAGLPPLVGELAHLKRRGARRSDLLEAVSGREEVWTPWDRRGAERAVWRGFGHGTPPAGVTSIAGVPPGFGAGFPVPNMPVIQDYGVVEIMRGCPQGCRFCHAGVYYRPYRMKPLDLILEEIDWLVHRQGYRDITLSSLSSGDYALLHELLDAAHARFGREGVSFQLPSLRVNSVTLPMIERLSRGKRSGLTFAVETAEDAFQRSVNKIVPLERTIAVAGEARRRGWRHAKLYFMIGLPVPDPSREAAAIVEYVRGLRRAVPLEFVVNVGTFVPKPHTPFQWEQQLDPANAQARMDEIRDGLPKGTRLRAHDPRSSWLESILTRGDERTASAIERAHDKGARLDAWGEHVNYDVWRDVVAETAGADVGLGPFSKDRPLPWDDVDVRVHAAAVRRERRRAEASETTDPCAPGCVERCGVCNEVVSVADVSRSVGSNLEDEARGEPYPDEGPHHAPAGGRHGTRYRLVVRYRKVNAAAFLPHLALVRMFERAWVRLNVPLELTQGYHPKARMSFGQPLPLGVASDDELLVVDVQKKIQLDTLSQTFGRAVPDGIEFRGAALLVHHPQEPRIPAPMQLYGASVFEARTVRTPEGHDGHGNDAVETLRAMLTDGGVPSSPLSEDDAGISFTLPAHAHGLGRLLKDGELRGSIHVVRRTMQDNAGAALFDSFAQLPHCRAVLRG